MREKGRDRDREKEEEKRKQGLLGMGSGSSPRGQSIMLSSLHGYFTGPPQQPSRVSTIAGPILHMKRVEELPKRSPDKMMKLEGPTPAI